MNPNSSFVVSLLSLLLKNINSVSKNKLYKYISIEISRSISSLIAKRINIFAAYEKINHPCTQRSASCPTIYPSWDFLHLQSNDQPKQSKIYKCEKMFGAENIHLFHSFIGSSFHYKVTSLKSHFSTISLTNLKLTTTLVREVILQPMLKV